jgi:hypothetical protein
MLEESIALCCDPTCCAVGRWAAAVSAATAALAVAVGAAAVDAPPAGAGFEVAVAESVVRLWVSRLPSAAALLVPVPLVPLVDEDVLPADVAEAAAAAGAEGIPTSAAASACSSNVSALDAGSVAESVAECLAGGSLESPAAAGWDLAAVAVLVVAGAFVAPPPIVVSFVAASSVGVAASDWARVAEKSLVSADACALPDAVDWVDPVFFDELGAVGACVAERVLC